MAAEPLALVTYVSVSRIHSTACTQKGVVWATLSYTLAGTGTEMEGQLFASVACPHLTSTLSFKSLVWHVGLGLNSELIFTALTHFFDAHVSGNLVTAIY